MARRFRTSAPQQLRPVTLGAVALAVLCGALIAVSSSYAKSSTPKVKAPSLAGSMTASSARPQCSRGRPVLQDAPHPPDIDSLIPSYWRRLVAICPSDERHYKPCAQLNAAQRSSPHNVSVQPFRFGGLGVWNTLTFSTVTEGGQHKSRGGDVWVAVLADTARGRRVPARVFDLGDGTYQVAFIPLRPGVYSLTLRLYYTLCAGLQEPFKDHRNHLTAAEAHCFEGRKSVNVTLLELPDRAHPHSCWQAPGSSVSNGFLDQDIAHRLDPLQGTQALPSSWAPVKRSDLSLWRNGSMLHLDKCCSVPWQLARSANRSRAILWGDSTQRYPWIDLLRLARVPCAVHWQPRAFFEHWGVKEFCTPASPGQVDPEAETALSGCTGGAAWATVPVGTNAIEVSQYFSESLLFDLERWAYNNTFSHSVPGAPPTKQFSLVYDVGYGCLPINMVVKTLKFVNTSSDVIVFNAGPHCLGTLTFAEWQRYIDDLAALLVGLKSTVVWRTSFPVREHVFRNRSGTNWLADKHFNTEGRRMLFDSYAEQVMRASGIKVWDITAFGLAGEYRLNDMQHLDGQSTRAMNLEMAHSVLC